MITEHVFSRLTFAFDMCSYNILKTMLVLFYPVLVECSADIFVYLTAFTTVWKSGLDEPKIPNFDDNRYIYLNIFAFALG